MEGHNSDKSVEVQHPAIRPEVILKKSAHKRKSSQNSANLDQPDVLAQVPQELTNEKIGESTHKTCVGSTQRSNEGKRIACLARKLLNELIVSHHATCVTMIEIDNKIKVPHGVSTISRLSQLSLKKSEVPTTSCVPTNDAIEIVLAKIPGCSEIQQFSEVFMPANQD